MGEWLKKMLAKAKELWGKWSGVQKGILIGIVVVVIGAIILVSNISTAPTTVQLFSTAITDAGARDRIVFRMDQEGVEGCGSWEAQTAQPQSRMGRGRPLQSTAFSIY